MDFQCSHIQVWILSLIWKLILRLDPTSSSFGKYFFPWRLLSLNCSHTGTHRRKGCACSLSSQSAKPWVTNLLVVISQPWGRWTQWSTIVHVRVDRRIVPRSIPDPQMAHRLSPATFIVQGLCHPAEGRPLTSTHRAPLLASCRHGGYTAWQLPCKEHQAASCPLCGVAAGNEWTVSAAAVSRVSAILERTIITPACAQGSPPAGQTAASPQHASSAARRGESVLGESTLLRCLPSSCSWDLGSPSQGPAQPWGCWCLAHVLQLLQWHFTTTPDAHGVSVQNLGFAVKWGRVSLSKRVSPFKVHRPDCVNGTPSFQKKFEYKSNPSLCYWNSEVLREQWVFHSSLISRNSVLPEGSSGYCSVHC